jgi:hypothetical protein
MSILMNICTMSYEIEKNEQVFVSLKPLYLTFSKVTDRIEMRGEKSGRGVHDQIECGPETGTR